MTANSTNAPEPRIVEAWHEALNAGDAEHLVELSHPGVAVGGPRGTGSGAHLLREWVERANIRLLPRRLFHSAETVVVEGEARWSQDEGNTRTVGTVFVVRDGLVASVLRYEDLASALATANLDESREVRAEG